MSDRRARNLKKPRSKFPTTGFVATGLNSSDEIETFEENVEVFQFEPFSFEGPPIDSQQIGFSFSCEQPPYSSSQVSPNSPFSFDSFSSSWDFESNSGPQISQDVSSSQDISFKPFDLTIDSTIFQAPDSPDDDLKALEDVLAAATISDPVQKLSLAPVVVFQPEPTSSDLFNPSMNFLRIAEARGRDGNTCNMDLVHTFPYFSELELNQVEGRIREDLLAVQQTEVPVEGQKLSLFANLQNQRKLDLVQSISAKLKMIELIRKNNLEILKIEEHQVIADFPHEIWNHLLSFLPFGDCLSFSAICKSNYFFLWQNLRKLNFKVSDPTPLFNIMRLVHSPAQITQLTFSLESVRTGINLGLSQSLSHLTNLRILQLFGFEFASESFASVFEKIPHLWKISLHVCVDEPIWLKNLLEVRKASLSLNLHTGYPATFGSNFLLCQRLTHLNLNFVQAPSLAVGAGLVDCLLQLFGLVDLKISIRSHAMTPCALYVGYGLSRLKSLRTFLVCGVPYNPTS